jgi:hypothetical protein
MRNGGQVERIGSAGALWGRRGLWVAAGALLALLVNAPARAASYATPEAAMDAFKAALAPADANALLDLLGRQYEADLLGGDPAAARQGYAALQKAAAESITVESEGADRAVIVMGRRGWPMPVPLVKGADGWTFDMPAGIEEITDRRIGRNELSAIEFCNAFIDAQREFASRDHDGNGVLEYAQRLASSPGKHDGLYWPDEGGGDVSPLGPLAANAEQYLGYRKEGEPYRGYFFRILTRQGSNPPVGRYDYVINGHMLAGFGLVAWPADYGRSGIMTFQCSHHGRVFEKDLGPQTGALAAKIASYDPDRTWSEVADD